MNLSPLNLFYEEPDPDRWLPYDRYPRKLVRRIYRGKQRSGGVMMIVINLMKGLDKLDIPYRLNDYKYIRKHPEEIACIIGKPHLLFKKKWANPVILGAGIYSHPIDEPDLFEKHPNVKRVLVPGEWMLKMFEPYYGDKVLAWPVGIDTTFWIPDNKHPEVDLFIYDKPLWDHQKHVNDILNPIVNYLKSKKISFRYVKYGNYTLEQLLTLTQTSKACIFLAEHETQGLAYQQILSTNTPILAYDKGGVWPDPSYYPKVQYSPVSSVPYWDERCGLKFSGGNDFKEILDLFLSGLNTFRPREYILENLTLEKCAELYVDIFRRVEAELKTGI